MPFCLTARYVLPVDQPPIRDGLVTIVGERIAAVGENLSGKPPHQLGNVALLPGLVNAHTHLEFSDLDAPLGRAGMPLPDWLRQVITHREQTPGDPAAAIACGIQELVATGTTTVGEISTPASASLWNPQVPLDVTVFLELLGLRSERIDELCTMAEKHCGSRAEKDRPGNNCSIFYPLTLPSSQGGEGTYGSYFLDDPKQSNVTPGVSPHAPYSVHPEVVHRICRRPETNRLVAMHVAESREELELLQSGTGPFVDLLEERGFWEPSAIPAGTKPMDYLRELSAAQRSLVIHGNYLNHDELEFLAAHRRHMSLIYCPRTHAYFCHERYLLDEALRRGVHVALGTDSLASNPDLNLVAEMRLVAQQYPSLPAEQILSLGTIAGAGALGIAEDVGTIAPGKLANLVAIPIPPDEGDPYELVLHAGSTPVATWHRGRATVG